MRRVRSLGNKIALLFFLITGAAFGAIYFWVVTQPESNLEERRLQDLAVVADQFRAPLEARDVADAKLPSIEKTVRAVAEASDSRITLFAVKEAVQGRQFDKKGLRFPLIADSSEQRAYPSAGPLVRRAVQTGRAQQGFGSFNGDDVGLVAQPLGPKRQAERVALYSRDFEEVAETVSFIRERVLWATAAALLIALVGGYFVAWRLALRVRRIEGAAADVAHGRFHGPLPVDSEDELGQLTRTFNEMQARLQRMDMARKEFIATASHELRTPIFSLAGFVELLQDEELDEATRREFVETMREQVERLQKLSVDLLDLSRLDSGSVELQTEPVDLAELSRTVAGEFRPALADHDSELQMDLGPEGPQADCDRERTVQIVRILLDNAIRHTPRGTEVIVSAHRDNGSTELTVADTGPGLPEDSQDKAFERFYTGDAARGAGLGLAIARELAERMDGRLVLTSSPGDTRFTLELPSNGSSE